MAGVCEGECKGHSPGDEPTPGLDGGPKLYEALEGESGSSSVAEPTT